MPLSMIDSAEKLGVSTANLGMAISRGKIKRLDQYSSFEELEEDYRGSILSRGEEAAAKIDVEGYTLNQLRMKNEIAKLAMLNMDVEERKAKLVYRDTVDRIVASIFSQYKDGLAGLPARVAPVMAAKLGVDQHELMICLEDMMRDYLGRLPETLDLDFSTKRTGRPRKSDATGE